MNAATKRSILRWVHIVCTIPMIGYVYGPASEVEQYAGAVRLGFVPIIMLSGYWMYAGAIFAVVGVALWLGINRAEESNPAILSQIVLFIATKISVMLRARRAR